MNKCAIGCIGEIASITHSYEAKLTDAGRRYVADRPGRLSMLYRMRATELLH